MILTDFESYTFFPGQHWSHTWERQHELITRFAIELPDKLINICPPLGLINHNPFTQNFLQRLKSYRKHQDRITSQNPIRENMNLVTSPYVPFHNSLIGKMNYYILKEKMGLSKNNFFWSTYMNPTIYEFFRKSKYKVYDLAERRMTNPHLSERILRWEKKAVVESDLVIVDNHATYDDYKHLNSHIFYIPQGVNCSTFFKTDDCSSIREFIGYIGNFHFAIDYDFLDNLIKNNPNQKFLFIGGIIEEEANRILKYPNVTYIPQIPKEQLNQYLSKMKIGLIPYVVNDHTVGVYPTKLFEYLAAGVPVVSTPLPEVCQYANDDYLKIVNQPLDLSSLHFPMKSYSLMVEENTWDIRWQKYKTLISQC